MTVDLVTKGMTLLEGYELQLPAMIQKTRLLLKYQRRDHRANCVESPSELLAETLSLKGSVTEVTPLAESTTESGLIEVFQLSSHWNA